MRKPRNAFTLIELLVVIAIIVILVSILVPVVGALRNKAYAVKAQAQINALAGAIESYQGTFRAYPGPLSTADIIAGIPPSGVSRPDSNFRVTGAENLVLGLLGGLYCQGSSIYYNKSYVGMGPRSLAPGAAATPYQLFFDNWAGQLTPGDGIYRYGPNDSDKACDSPIPEFLDPFPEPMPVLYLRARAGADTSLTIGGPGADTPPQQYDIRQYYNYICGGDAAPNTPLTLWGYLQADRNKTTGLWKRGTPGDGLISPGPSSACGFFRNPSNSTGDNSPRGKDGYILLSPGIDRIYGTNDDITNVGSVAPF